VLIKQCVGTCIVTHRGPTSPQRHEPPPRISASYRCTLISEEPQNRAGQEAVLIQWTRCLDAKMEKRASSPKYFSARLKISRC
jgi:hypothetical protein